MVEEEAKHENPKTEKIEYRNTITAEMKNVETAIEFLRNKIPDMGKPKVVKIIVYVEMTDWEWSTTLK